MFAGIFSNKHFTFFTWFVLAWRAVIRSAQFMRLNQNAYCKISDTPDSFRRTFRGLRVFEVLGLRS